MEIRFDYNAICKLEDLGFGMTDLPERGTDSPMSTWRAMLYAGSDFETLEAAGNHLGENFQEVRDEVLKAWERDLPLLMGSSVAPPDLTE